MTEYEERKKRLLGVLDYDEVKECDRIRHLMQRCGLSRYLAKRALNGRLPKSGLTGLEMALVLDVRMEWLWWGQIVTVAPRTFRIHAYVLNYSRNEIDKMARLAMAAGAGHKKANNLVNLIIEEKLSFLSAAQLM